MWTTTPMTILLDAAEKAPLSRQHQHLCEHLSNLRSHRVSSPVPEARDPAGMFRQVTGIPGQERCWTTAWAWLGHPGIQTAFLLQPPDGAKIKGITLGAPLSKPQHFVSGYRGDLPCKCAQSGNYRCVLACVSTSPWLVLNAIGSFSSSRMEGATERRGKIKMDAPRGEPGKQKFTSGTGVTKS